MPKTVYQLETLLHNEHWLSQEKETPKPDHVDVGPFKAFANGTVAVENSAFAWPNPINYTTRGKVRLRRAYRSPFLIVRDPNTKTKYRFRFESGVNGSTWYRLIPKVMPNKALRKRTAGQKASWLVKKSGYIAWCTLGFTIKMLLAACEGWTGKKL
jgi:hypothetical protein